MRYSPRIFMMLIPLLMTVGLIALSPFLNASPQKLTAQFNAEIQALIGEKADAASSSLSYFPIPELVLTHVKIGENEWLKAEKLSIKIGYFGLWSRALSNYRLTFTKAVIDDITFEEKAIARIKLLMQLEASQLFGEINFKESEFTLKTPLQEVTLNDFNGTLNFEKTTTPFKLKGSAFKDNEKISFEIKVDNPQAAFIINKKSPFSATINSSFGTLNLISEASFSHGLNFNGLLSIKKDDFSLKANSDYRNNSLSLTNLTLKSNSLNGEGVLLIEPLSKKIIGTMSFEEVTLAKSFDSSSAPSVNAMQEAIPTVSKFYPLAEIDLRLSAKKITTAKHIIENVSGILLGKSDNLLLSSLNFKINEGEFKGEAKLNKTGFNLTLTGQNIAFMSLFPAIKLEAKGDIALQFLMNDKTFPYQTDLKFALKEGVAHYGNLNERLLEAVRRPLSRANVTLTNGSTRFQSLTGQVSFDATKWRITEPLLCETSRLTAQIEGGGEGEKLTLIGHARLKALGIEMPYTVTGLIKEPRLSFAPHDVINRSPAAKPLREGARDENAVNAVRDIMNRQTPNLAPTESPSVPLPLRLP